MSAGLDTSVVLRLLTGEPAGQAEVAREYIAASRSPVAVSDLVVTESYFALRHHYAVPHLDAVRALRELLSDARIRPTGVARGVLATLAARMPTRTNAGLVDHFVHADYERDGTRLATFDRALARLADAELLG